MQIMNIFGFEFLPMDPNRTALFGEFLETAVPTPAS